MRSHKSQEEHKKLLRTIFDHVNGLPYYDVKNSVILVSYTEDHAFAFQKITGKERISSDKMPFLHKFKDGTSLIDPTPAFLQPESNINFVTMHYLMNIAEQVKFVFVFNAADTTDMPMKNITKVLTKFMSMFTFFKTKEEVAALTASCGILINGCRAAEDITIYSERIGGENYNGKLLEPAYLLGKQAESIRELVRGILKRRQILLFPAGNAKSFLQEFTDFVTRLSPFELAGKVELRLLSAYPDFVQCNIYKEWEQTFKKIYSDLQEVVVGGKGHILQSALEKTIGEYDRRNSQDKLEVKESSRAVRLLQVINALMQIIMKLVQTQNFNSLDPKSNEQVLAQFLDTLYSSGFLKVQFIRRFLMSYFLIRKFLSKTGDQLDDPEVDLFHRISFCDILGNIDAFNLKMRALTLALLAQLEEDLAAEGKEFPWEETLGLLNSLLSLREQPQFAFFTDRITKKLLKCRAQLAHRLIGRAQRNPKQMLRAELKFVRYSCESRLVPDRMKTDVLKSIALKLSEGGRNDLALQILTALPQYEVHQNVRYLYEKQLQLNAQIWQYLPASRRQEIIAKHFEGYQHFMLTVGFVETFRELCMECLRLADTEEDRRRFKDALLRAKGQWRDLHSRFLQQRIIDEKQVVIGQDFLDRIQRQTAREALI